MTTPYHSQHWAALLRYRGASSGIGALARSLGGAKVDLNPHQVSAALFALRSPLSRGVLLADEVGLGKTIEAGLVLSQRWAEGRRRLLLIVPATLRVQWAAELRDRFALPSIVIDGPALRAGGGFDRANLVCITSYELAARSCLQIRSTPWDLVVLDEAHRLRNVYKKGSKVAAAIRDALAERPKLLLTATPLQNSLSELFGLVSVIDERVFGSIEAFNARFTGKGDFAERSAALRERLKLVCQRTLRRQVSQYVRFTGRIPFTLEFTPSADEQRLYNGISEYLRRETLHALPSSQRALMTLVLRKLLASSSRAIAGTLRGMVERLGDGAGPGGVVGQLREDFEELQAIEEEWEESTLEAAPSDQSLEAELGLLRGFVAEAERIPCDAKAVALLGGLERAFKEATALGAARKAVIFTESRRTQDWLAGVLEEGGYGGQLVLINGSNTHRGAVAAHKAYVQRHRGTDRITGIKAVDTRAALVEAFRTEGTILLATEAASEGVNLQFCSLVVNYDLPWNPQRVEQRIGRCHRYGQQHDVVVVNLINTANEADRRVFQLLNEKFQLFSGVFGASDEVLGALERGVDIERLILDAYQRCRSSAEIHAAFDRLTASCAVEISATMAATRVAVLEGFDVEVQEKLGQHRDAAQALLDQDQRCLLSLSRTELGRAALFDDALPRFHYKGGLGPAGDYNLNWRAAELGREQSYHPEHPLARALIERALGRSLPIATLVLDYAAIGAPVAALTPLRGGSGWLRVACLELQGASPEQHLLRVSCMDGGEALGERESAWLLEAPGVVGDHPAPAVPEGPLQALESAAVTAILQQVELRGGAWLDEESAKLDRWADDLKLGLERAIDELDRELRATRDEARQVPTLAAKLSVQARGKEIEARRRRLRDELHAEREKIEVERGRLLDDAAVRLQAVPLVHPHFTCRWQLV